MFHAHFFIWAGTKFKKQKNMVPKSRNLRSIEWYQKTYVQISWDYPFKLRWIFIKCRELKTILYHTYVYKYLYRPVYSVPVFDPHTPMYKNITAHGVIYQKPFSGVGGGGYY
jgi:hypothetical protein